MIRRFVNLAFPFLVILFFAVCVAAQEPQCALTRVSLKGLSLGMSPAEVQAVVGKDLKIKVKSNGDRSFFQNYIEKRAPASLDGIRAIYLRFLDGRLYQIEIFYEELSDVPTLEGFTSNLSARMNLPAGVNWQFVKNQAVIDCGTLTIIAEKLLNPRVELTDTAKRDEALSKRKKGR